MMPAVQVIIAISSLITALSTAALVVGALVICARDGRRKRWANTVAMPIGKVGQAPPIKPKR